jgi:hypothetical protein
VSTRSKTRLINRKRVKQFALIVAQERFHKFNRVGDEFFLKCEVTLREFIRSSVRRLPSKGETII